MSHVTNASPMRSDRGLSGLDSGLKAGLSNENPAVSSESNVCRKDESNQPFLVHQHPYAYTYEVVWHAAQTYISIMMVRLNYPW